MVIDQNNKIQTNLSYSYYRYSIIGVTEQILHRRIEHDCELFKNHVIVCSLFFICLLKKRFSLYGTAQYSSNTCSSSQSPSKFGSFIDHQR